MELTFGNILLFISKLQEFIQIRNIIVEFNCTKTYGYVKRKAIFFLCLHTSQSDLFL